MPKFPIIGLAGRAGSGKDTVGNFIAENYRGVCIGQADPMKRFVRDVFGFSEELLWGSSEKRATAVPTPDLFKAASRAGDLIVDKGELTRVFSTCDSGLLRRTVENWIYSKISEFSKAGGGTITPRFVLQTLGTEVGRELDVEAWSKYAIRSAKAIVKGAAYSPTKGLGMLPAGEAPAHFAIENDIRFLNEGLNVLETNGALIKMVRYGDRAPISSHSSEQLQIPDHLFDQVIYNGDGLETLFSQVRNVMHSEYGV